MALHSVSPGTYPVRQLLMLITFFSCCAANDERNETAHSRKEFLSYATIEIAVMMEVTVEKCRIL